MSRLVNILSLLFITSLGFAQRSYQVKEIDKLDAVLNTQAEESLPIYSPDGKLYFVRTLFEENFGGAISGQDIWMAERNGSQWSEATNQIKRLNNIFNNAVIGIADSGNTLFLNGSYSSKPEYQTGVSVTYYVDGNWKRPRNLRIKGFNPKAPDHLSYYVDGDNGVMLLSYSNSKDSLNEDIYVSFLRKGRVWSKPESLGETINTASADFSPFIEPDGKTIYFSSYGHGGYGGADVFTAYRLDDTWTHWSKPKNLGEPINSDGFDAYFTKFGNDGYFASNRSSDLADLYWAQFKLKDPETARLASADEMKKEDVFSLRGFLDIKNPERVGMVSVLDQEGTVVQRVKPKDDGSFLIQGLEKYDNYSLDLNGKEKEIENFEIYFVNQDGSRVYLNEGLITGQYPFETLDKDIRAVLMSEVSEDSELGLTQFAFDTTTNFPVGCYIYSYDVYGLKQETTVVNKHGKFELNTLIPDKIYRIKVENGTLTNNSKIYVYSDGEPVEVPGNILRGALFKKFEGQLVALDPNSEEGRYAYEKLKRSGLDDIYTDSESDITELDASTFGFEYNRLPPDEGTRVFLTDESGNVVDEAYTDADGLFKFKKLDPDRKYSINVDEESDYKGDLSLFLIDDDGLKVPIADDISKGKNFDGRAILAEEEKIKEGEQQFTFKYSALPPVGSKVYLTDEQDNLIDSAYVDAAGNFKFRKLNPDDSYIMKMAEDDSDVDLSYFIVDDSGQDIKVGTGDTDGDIIKPSELKAKSQFVSKFAFDYNTLPSAGTKVYLEDEYGNIVDSSFVDARGNFRFQRLDPDKNYNFIVDDEEFDMSAAELIAMENGKKRRLKKIPIGFALYSLDLMEVADSELDMTRFQLDYDGDIPEEAHAYLYDEETNEIIEEVDIEEDGSFSFEALDSDMKYHIKFDEEIDNTQARYFAIEEPDIQLDIASILQEEKNALAEKKAQEDERRRKEEDRLAAIEAKQAVEEELKRKEEAARLALEEEVRAAKEIEEQEKLSSIKGDWVVYFGFNEFLLKPDQIAYLKTEIADKIKSDSSIRIALEGHADNRGSDEVNYRMSIFRISNVVDHLEMLGVDDSRMKVSPKGEEEPVASNDTEEGRAKNRRVEIVILSD